MEKTKLLNETGKASYKIEEAKENENNPNDVGAPPLVIVVQGGKNVLYNLSLTQFNYKLTRISKCTN